MSRPVTLADNVCRGAIVPAKPEAIVLAAASLRAGDIVGMPTETVYGLAADATSGEAVARIYATKRRPQFNPLISHVADIAEAERHGIFTPEARRLAEAFWPGPLTLVLPLRPGSPVSDLARAGLDTIALRVPAHPVARALIAETGRPLAAPSANRSGRISPTSALHVQTDLGHDVSIILDGGDATVGVESTVISVLNGYTHQLRAGGITRESVVSCIERALDENPPREALVSPGLLASHYAPIAPLQMNMSSPTKGAGFLAYGPEYLHGFEGFTPLLNLSPGGDLGQAAMCLFSALRELDGLRPSRIDVAPIPETGLGEAINDRLRRAAAPR
jgi:L-threonylcarbamoyladenylate synthase